MDKQYFSIRPLPCVKDEHGKIKGQTIRALIAKIDEELNELKCELYHLMPTYYVPSDIPDMISRAKEQQSNNETTHRFPHINEITYHLQNISEEAADTITAITTLLEALGIDAEMRDDAQNKVNMNNRKRGRLMMDTD